MDCPGLDLGPPIGMVVNVVWWLTKMREDEVLGVSRVRGRDHEDVCSEKGRGVSLLRNHGIVLVKRYGDRGPAHE